MSCCETIQRAVRSGHLNCLKYAHENGCLWNEKTTYWASLNGHLDCLKYAHEKGCPWHEKTTYWASLNGHLDCLKYIFEVVGCDIAPWDKDLDGSMSEFTKEIQNYLREVRDDWINKRNVPGINIKG